MFGTPGATGVWAEENTRPEIFDGIQRKESFGTSGPLIKVRFFGGWDYAKGLTTDDGLREESLRGRRPHGRRSSRHAEECQGTDLRGLGAQRSGQW